MKKFRSPMTRGDDGETVYFMVGGVRLLDGKKLYTHFSRLERIQL